MIWIFLSVICLAIALFAIDVFRHRHPLEAQEIHALATKRQRNKALIEYRFSTLPSLADPAEKKAMKACGEFVRCNLDYYDVPARIAGLLKYKKHEWIVIALISAKKVTRLWWNKGPNGTLVGSSLDEDALLLATNSMKTDTIAIFHNHPNGNPARFRTNIPSAQDLGSAERFHQKFGNLEISLLEFICERGSPYLYYAGFTNRVVQIEPIIEEIQIVNASGIMRNYALHKELKRTTSAEQIPGGPQQLEAFVNANMVN